MHGEDSIRFTCKKLNSDSAFLRADEEIELARKIADLLELGLYETAL